MHDHTCFSQMFMSEDTWQGDHSTDGMLRGGEFGYLVDSFREHLTDTAQQLFPCIMPHSGSLVGFRSKSPLLILPIHGFSVSRL